MRHGRQGRHGDRDRTDRAWDSETGQGSETYMWHSQLLCLSVSSMAWWQAKTGILSFPPHTPTLPSHPPPSPPSPTTDPTPTTPTTLLPPSHPLPPLCFPYLPAPKLPHDSHTHGPTTSPTPIFPSLGLVLFSMAKAELWTGQGRFDGWVLLQLTVSVCGVTVTGRGT